MPASLCATAHSSTTEAFLARLVSNTIDHKPELAWQMQAVLRLLSVATPLVWIQFSDWRIFGNAGGGRGWGRQRRPRRRDAVTPFTDASALDSIADLYGFPPGFAFRDALVYRENTAPATSNVNSLPKRLYFVSPGMLSCPCTGPQLYQLLPS